MHRAIGNMDECPFVVASHVDYRAGELLFSYSSAPTRAHPWLFIGEEVCRRRTGVRDGWMDGWMDGYMPCHAMPCHAATAADRRHSRLRCRCNGTCAARLLGSNAYCTIMH